MHSGPLTNSLMIKWSMSGVSLRAPTSILYHTKFKTIEFWCIVRTECISDSRLLMRILSRNGTRKRRIRQIIHLNTIEFCQNSKVESFVTQRLGYRFSSSVRTLFQRHIHTRRRLIRYPKLRIIFHKRATEYRSLLWKMTYKDKGSY